MLNQEDIFFPNQALFNLGRLFNYLRHLQFLLMQKKFKKK